MYNALRIAWHHYYHLSKEQVLDKKRISHHKRVIRKLQHKLRKTLTPFIIYEAVAWGFYKLNPELFKEDVSFESVEKAIVKTTAIMGSGRRIDLVEELKTRDRALDML